MSSHMHRKNDWSFEEDVMYALFLKKNSTLNYPQSQIYLALSWKGGGWSGNTRQSSKSPEKNTGYAIAASFQKRLKDEDVSKSSLKPVGLRTPIFETQSNPNILSTFWSLTPSPWTALNSCLLAKLSNIGHSAVFFLGHIFLPVYRARPKDDQCLNNSIDPSKSFGSCGEMLIWSFHLKNHHGIL